MNLSDTDQAPYSAPVNTGGAAFPQFEVVAGERDGHGDAIDSYTVAKGGMSLRDYFAGQVLSNVGSNWSDEETRQHYAEHIYLMADAMLAAREVRK